MKRPKPLDLPRTTLLSKIGAGAMGPQESIYHKIWIISRKSRLKNKAAHGRTV